LGRDRGADRRGSVGADAAQEKRMKHLQTSNEGPLESKKIDQLKHAKLRKAYSTDRRNPFANRALPFADQACERGDVLNQDYQ
jgi:hypothetical protein